MKRNFYLRIVFLLSGYFLPILVFAQNFPQKFPVPQIDFHPKHYVCYRAQTPIVIDGDLRETSWQKARWTDDFVDIQGAKMPKPRFRTRAKMLWNDDFFYIAAELQEPHIWAKLMQRDTIIYHDNDFEVFIDPDGDTHQYYELEMNARNTVWDLLLIKPYRDGGLAVNGWDIHDLKSGVKIFGSLNNASDKDSCWTVEIAMPWAALKECANKPAPPNSGDLWRVNFSRVEWQVEIKNGKYFKKINPKTGKPFPEDNWVWSPQGLINMHFPEMWGFVQFSNFSAGEGKDVFVLPREEITKWKLRQLYYRQQNYRLNFGQFADTMHKLNLQGDFFGKSQKISLKTGWNQFEFQLKDEKNNCVWFIEQSGKIVKQKLK